MLFLETAETRRSLQSLKFPTTAFVPLGSKLLQVPLGHRRPKAATEAGIFNDAEGSQAPLLHRRQRGCRAPRR